MSDIIERLRRWTHAVDAAPASDLMDEAAGEIERLRAVTEPMPKEKRAEVSAGWRNHIRPPDAADRALAAACDKAWGLTAEPVAWAVVYPNDEVAVIAFKRSDADERATASDRIVPLYRQPQPTLTDAEREAVEAAVGRANRIGTEYAIIDAATLRGLFDRTK